MSANECEIIEIIEQFKHSEEIYVYTDMIVSHERVSTERTNNDDCITFQYLTIIGDNFDPIIMGNVNWHTIPDDLHFAFNPKDTELFISKLKEMYLEEPNRFVKG